MRQKVHEAKKIKRAKIEREMERRSKQTTHFFRHFRCEQPLIYKALGNASGCILSDERYKVKNLKPKFNIIPNEKLGIPVCQCADHEDDYGTCVCNIFTNMFFYLMLPLISARFSEDFFCEMPIKFSKSNVPGTEMTFIAVEKLVSIVFRHVIFCVTQAVTSLKIGQNL